MAVYIGIIGLILGSFYNVVGLRIPLGQSIVRPRSACPACQSTLTSKELIPIASYILQKGKCRNCQAPISLMYPIMEGVTASLFLFGAHVANGPDDLLVSWTLISLAVILTVSDLSFLLIPNRILFVFFILFTAERVWMPLQPWWDGILGGSVAFFIVFLIMIISKGMGGGDVKLFALLGFVLGSKLVLLTFLLACTLGTLFGYLLVFIGYSNKKEPMAFGPFIMLGALLSYYVGEEIIALYSSLW